MGLTLNKEKCQLLHSQIKFLGQVIDANGICPDPDKIAAIQDVPTPGNVGDFRCFLGMANHLSKFLPNLAEKTTPRREFLNKKNEWVWGEPQCQAFEDVKQALVVSPVLSLFDQNRDTIIVSANASSHAPIQLDHCSLL